MLIDRQLTNAGWSVQDNRSLNLFAAQGVARREATMATGHGRADYLLYVDQRVVGVIEAKPVGTRLSGVEWQSAMYAGGLPADVRLAALTKDGRLPFVFEASGTETHFTNGFEPEPRARQIFNFPKAATLAKTLRGKDEERPTWRGKVTVMPPLDTTPLSPAQVEAINDVEQSLREQRYDRSLVLTVDDDGAPATSPESARLRADRHDRADPPARRNAAGRTGTGSRVVRPRRTSPPKARDMTIRVLIADDQTIVSSPSGWARRFAQRNCKAPLGHQRGVRAAGLRVQPARRGVGSVGTRRTSSSPHLPSRRSSEE